MRTRKLTDAQVSEIRTRYAIFDNARSQHGRSKLAAEFGVSVGSIVRIARGQSFYKTKHDADLSPEELAAIHARRKKNYRPSRNRGTAPTGGGLAGTRTIDRYHREHEIVKQRIFGLDPR